MMGFGSYGYGGSSSASNLSALAPPFTVDRSGPKTNPNSLVDFNSDLPYVMAVPLNSSLHNWMPPHYPTTSPDFFPNPSLEDDSVHSSNGYIYSSLQPISSPRSTPLPSGSIGYKYPGSPPISSAVTTLLPSLDPVAPATVGAFSYGQCSEGVTTNLAEAKPYYPSFVLQKTHSDGPMESPDQAGYDLLSSSYASAVNGSSHDECAENLTGLEYTSQWGGVWNGSADWNRDKQIEVDGNFYPKETTIAWPSNYKNYANQGTYASNGLGNFEELPHGIDMMSREKVVESVSTNILDDRSLSGQNPMLMPSGYSNTSILGSAILPETHAKKPSVDYVSNPKNHTMPYGSFDEGSAQHSFSMNPYRSAAFPVPASRLPAVGTSWLASNTGSLKAVNVTKDVADMDYLGNNSSAIKENHFLQTSEAKGHIDASNIGSDFNRNDPFLLQSTAAKYSVLSSSKNVLNNISDTYFEAKSEIPIPQVIPDIYGVTPDCNDAVNCAEKFAETLDHYNTAVDSPCWKGVPFSRFSPFKVSETATPQQLKKESCHGFNLQDPQCFNLGDGAQISARVSGENTFFHENGFVKNGSVPPLNKPSVDNLIFREHELDNAMVAEFKNSELIHESRKDYTLPCQSAGDSDIKTFHTVQLGTEEGEMASEEKVTSGTSVADFRMNTNDASEDDSSYVPFRAAKWVSQPPFYVENAPAKPLKFPRGQSTSKIDVHTLIKTMHNLSEMLLFHCSNDVCIVEEKDLEVLKCVIDNLETCVITNIEQRPPIQESILSQGGSCPIRGQLPDPLKGTNVVDNVHNQLDHQHALKGTKDHIMLSREDAKVSNIDPPRGDEDLTHDDNITQAIKKVLHENFDDEEELQPQILLYRNLWLEAEAAICSINYKARFNRLKIEMEKNKAKKAKDVSRNATDLKKLFRDKVSPVQSTVNELSPEANCPTAVISIHDSSKINPNDHADDDVKDRLHVLKRRFDDSKSFNSVNERDSSSSQVSPDLNNVEKLATDLEDSLNLNASIQNSDIIRTNSHSDDVMSRYHILKCRVDCSNSLNSVNEQDVWNSRVASDSNEVEKLAAEAKGNETANISIQEPPILSRMSHGDDVETSIPARFHILKCRADNSSTSNMEREQLLDVDLGSASKSNYWSINSEGLWEGMAKVNLKSAQQHHADNKLMANEYLASRSCRPGNQQLPLSAGWYDSSSSDWEHVLNEDLPGQN